MRDVDKQTNSFSKKEKKNKKKRRELRSIRDDSAVYYDTKTKPAETTHTTISFFFGWRESEQA